MENFTIKEILETSLKKLKIELFEEEIYHRTCMLFDIWLKQKELRGLFELYKSYEENVIVDLGPIQSYDRSKGYKEQYIKFLMNCNLIFLEEVTNPTNVIYLIYYWLLAEIKIDKKILAEI